MKFSKAIWIVCIAVFALCALGVGFAVWQIAKFGLADPFDAFQYPFLIVVSVFCIVTAAAILAHSRYVLRDGYLVVQLGYIQSKTSVKDVTSVLLDNDTKKLTVYFGEQSMTLALPPDENEKFVRALLAVNPDIDYGFTLADAPPKSKKK